MSALDKISEIPIEPRTKPFQDFCISSVGFLGDRPVFLGSIRYLAWERPVFIWIAVFVEVTIKDQNRPILEEQRIRSKRKL